MGENMKKKFIIISMLVIFILLMLPSISAVEYSTIKWELSKWANIYEKRESFLGLPPKDKKELLEGVGKWINKFEEERLKNPE